MPKPKTTSVQLSAPETTFLIAMLQSDLLNEDDFVALAGLKLALESESDSAVFDLARKIIVAHDETCGCGMDFTSQIDKAMRQSNKDNN